MAAPAATALNHPMIWCRQFDPEAPNQLWVMDVTEHPTGEGKVYLAAVLDAYSRRVVGRSIADRIRARRRRAPDGRLAAPTTRRCDVARRHDDENGWNCRGARW
jgi:transposase InsO family protein